MNIPVSSAPVVVAIDGSKAAIGAAVWAVKEASHHGAPLRLVHVIHTADRSTDRDDTCPIENEYAETCLRAACSAVKATGLPVHVQTSVLHGETGAVLIEESESATLICLGSTGLSRAAMAILGSTAAAVAERARCPVAIIRHIHNRPLPDVGFIAVILGGRPGNEEAIEWAMEEARARRAPVLVLGTWPWPAFNIDYEGFYRMLDHWLQRYPDVTVEVATTRMSAIRYLEGFIGALQLVVIGSEDADRMIDLVGPHTTSILAHTDCSVLIARGRASAMDCRRHDHRQTADI